jgi:hypothetical protein
VVEHGVQANDWAPFVDVIKRLVAIPTVTLHEVGDDDHCAPTDAAMTVHKHRPSGPPLGVDEIDLFPNPFQRRPRLSVADRLPTMDFRSVAIFRLANVQNRANARRRGEEISAQIEARLDLRVRRRVPGEPGDEERRGGRAEKDGAGQDCPTTSRECGHTANGLPYMVTRAGGYRQSSLPPAEGRAYAADFV